MIITKVNAKIREGMLVVTERTIKELEYYEIEDAIHKALGYNIDLYAYDHCAYMDSESKFIVFDFEVIPEKFEFDDNDKTISIGSALNHLCYLGQVDPDFYTVYYAW